MRLRSQQALVIIYQRLLLFSEILVHCKNTVYMFLSTRFRVSMGEMSDKSWYTVVCDKSNSKGRELSGTDKNLQGLDGANYSARD